MEKHGHKTKTYPAPMPMKAPLGQLNNFISNHNYFELND